MGGGLAHTSLIDSGYEKSQKKHEIKPPSHSGEGMGVGLNGQTKCQ